MSHQQINMDDFKLLEQLFNTDFYRRWDRRQRVQQLVKTSCRCREERLGNTAWRRWDPASQDPSCTQLYIDAHTNAPVVRLLQLTSD